MPKKQPDKAPYSAGARYERAAFRSYVRRRIRRWEDQSEVVAAELEEVEAWILKRQSRYDKRPGGL